MGGPIWDMAMSEFLLLESWLNYPEHNQEEFFSLALSILSSVTFLSYCLIGKQIKKCSGIPGRAECQRCVRSLPTAGKDTLQKQYPTVNGCSVAAEMWTKLKLSGRQTIHISYCSRRHLFPSVYPSFNKPMSHATYF